MHAGKIRDTRVIRDTHLNTCLAGDRSPPDGNRSPANGDRSPNSDRATVPVGDRSRLLIPLSGTDNYITRNIEFLWGKRERIEKTSPERLSRCEVTGPRHRSAGSHGSGPVPKKRGPVPEKRGPVLGFSGTLRACEYVSVGTDDCQTRTGPQKNGDRSHITSDRGYMQVARDLLSNGPG